MGSFSMELKRSVLLLVSISIGVISAQGGGGGGSEPDEPTHHIGCSPTAKKQCWHAYKRICIRYGYSVCPLEASTKPPGLFQKKKFCWVSVNRVYATARKTIKLTQLCFCEPKNCNPYQGSTEDVKLVEAADTYEEYLEFVQVSNGTAKNIVDFEYKENM